MDIPLSTNDIVDIWETINSLENFLILGLLSAICKLCEQFLSSSFFLTSDWKCHLHRHIFANQLSGELPGSWSALAALQYLYDPYFSVFKSNLTEFVCQTDTWTAINSLEDFLILGLIFPICKNCTFFSPCMHHWSRYWCNYKRALQQNALSGPIPATWSSLPPAFPNLEYLCVAGSVFFTFLVILTVVWKVFILESIKRNTSFQLVCYCQSPIHVRSFASLHCPTF